jgi:RND family efflux transporter MFP subunit
MPTSSRPAEPNNTVPGHDSEIPIRLMSYHAASFVEAAQAHRGSLGKIVGWLALAAAGLFLASCSHPKPPPPPTPKVTVAQPQSGTVTNWDEYPGHLEAVEMVEIRARVSGYLNSIEFQEGAEVSATNRLFVIDPRPYQAELERAQADRQQAETRLDLARNDARRAETLRGTRAISEEELDSRNKAVRQAEAALASSKAAEDVARLNLDYTEIKSPINGRIGRRLVTVGNYVQGNASGATVLATIVSQDPIYCYFDVDEAGLAKYRAFAKASQGSDQKIDAVPCELALANEQGFPHQGRLDFFDNQVNPQTGTIRLRAVFKNPDRALVPGMFANLRVMAESPCDMMLVPAVAIGSDLGYKYVYVVNKENAVENRPIEVGRAYGPLRSVLKGLSPDDRVVVNGLMTVMMLRPGAKVEAQTAAAAAPASPQKNATAKF